MPTCQCGATLVGRRRKCDACKRPPGEADPGERGPSSMVVAPTPDGLGERGRLLWVDLGQSLHTSAGQVALEACRIADRLEELDAVIAGRGVLNLLAFRTHFEESLPEGVELTVVVQFQRVLSEARQQSVTFSSLLTAVPALALRARGGAASDPEDESPPAPAARVSNPLDELTRRRQGKSLQ